MTNPLRIDDGRYYSKYIISAKKSRFLATVYENNTTTHYLHSHLVFPGGERGGEGRPLKLLFCVTARDSENIQSDNRFAPITPGSVGDRHSFATLRIG